MRKIVTFGDKILHQKSEIITEIDPETVELAEEMFRILFTSNGIGLAAVQVGVLKRLFITDVPNFGKHVMINPRILDQSFEKSAFEEGCLSLPGIAHEVQRPASVLIEYSDIKGKLIKIEADGLFAVCIQHEFDHLEGTLFIDRIPPEDKISKINEFKKLHIV